MSCRRQPRFTLPCTTEKMTRSTCTEPEDSSRGSRGKTKKTSVLSDVDRVLQAKNFFAPNAGKDTLEIQITAIRVRSTFNAKIGGSWPGRTKSPAMCICVIPPENSSIISQCTPVRHSVVSRRDPCRRAGAGLTTSLRNSWQRISQQAEKVRSHSRGRRGLGPFEYISLLTSRGDGCES